MTQVLLVFFLFLWMKRIHCLFSESCNNSNDLITPSKIKWWMYGNLLAICRSCMLADALVESICQFQQPHYSISKIILKPIWHRMWQGQVQEKRFGACSKFGDIRPKYRPQISSNLWAFVKELYLFLCCKVHPDECFGFREIGHSSIENVLHCMNIHQLCTSASLNGHLVAYENATCRSTHIAAEEVYEINLVNNPSKPPISTCRVLIDWPWQKRGHISLNGVVTAINDTHLLSN